MNKKSFEKERIELIENSRKNNTRIFLEKASKVKLGFKRRTIIIIGVDETLLIKNAKIIDEFKNIFKSL
jgi:hypothetical protein